jgi:tetratricopeptide (TPR) repeat protein
MEAEKSVFISYRRTTSRHLARAVFMDLRSNGYDAFMDVDTLDSGTFDLIILNQIAARAHFVLLLSLGALDRCNDPDDWLRREIEHAIDLKRNIVPIIEEGFSYAEATPYLTGKLADLPRYNGVPLYHAYFDAALDNLRNRFLKQPVYNIVLSPAPAAEQIIVRQQIQQIANEPAPTPKQVRARSLFAQAVSRHAAGETALALAAYTEVLKQDPENARAYLNRGTLKIETEDYAGALLDLNHAVRLDPREPEAYAQRGWARNLRANMDGALADYDEALRLNPRHAQTLFRRGWLYHERGSFDAAIADHTQAIQLDPQNADYFSARAASYYHQGSYQLAVDDWTEAIRLRRDDAGLLYNNRGEAYFAMGHYLMAMADFKQANSLKPNQEIVLAGLAITAHALGHLNDARKYWREVLKRNKACADIDVAQKSFRWAEPLTEEARKMLLSI